ncbi:MAG TPA: hypothetical protein VIQ00_05115 [Chitinophagaceae bacterium]
MKWIFCLLIFCLIILPGCDLRKRENQLEKRTAILNQKEQELLLKEKSLQLKEQELEQREKLVDSTMNIFNANDSIKLVDSTLIGTWEVRMRCTETNCSGSAVGDVKTERWVLGYQNQNIITKAYDGNKLVRIYTGKYIGDRIQLTAQNDDIASPSFVMLVTLQKIKENEMTGRREILRQDVCRTIYDLEVKKVITK